MAPVLGAVGSALGAIGGGSVAAGALTVGSTAAGLLNQRKASKDAQATQQQGVDLATQRLDAQLAEDQLRRQQDIARLDPFIEGSGDALQLQRTIAGVNGPEQQREFFDNFQFSPFAEFQRREGLRAIDQGSARAGTLKSGSRLKSIANFINDLSSGEIRNQFNQAGAITGVGLQAAGALSGVPAPSQAGQANLAVQGGQQAGQAILGRSAALQSGVSDLAGSAINFFRNQQPQGGNAFMRQPQGVIPNQISFTA
jgi:hypothetical protein